MGKSTPQAPPAPNPSGLVQQQGAQNVGTAIANARLNNTNQVGPNGSLTYSETGGGYDSNNTWVPSFTATTALSPGQQKLYDTQQGISQGTSDLAKSYIDRIGAATATPFTLDNMPQTGPMPVYDKDYRQHEYDTILQRNQPQQDNDQRALAQRLADQGIGINDPAYRTAMDQYDRGVNDFRLGADLQSGQQATQDFGNQVQGYGLTVDARNRAIQEALLQRTQPINEVTALMGTGPGVQMPQFVNTPTTQVAPTDVYAPYAMQQQAGLQQQQIATQANSAATGGLFGLGGAALMGGAMFL
jgi:hypothetical protein